VSKLLHNKLFTYIVQLVYTRNIVGRESKFNFIKRSDMGKLIQSPILLCFLVFTLTASSDKSLNALISSHSDHTTPTTQTRKIRPDGTCNENASPFNCPATMYLAGKAGVPGPIGQTGPQGMTGPTGATGETGEGLSCLVDTTITTSGVYFLCNDVDTISIQSSDVTLDLNGYRIFNGVTLSDGISNVIVKNGQIGPDTTINIAANAITNISTDGILTGSCTDCIFQDLVIEHCANGIHMVATDPTMISNNKIINCICNYNSSNGIFLDKMSGNAIQECTCSYNLTGRYSNNKFTVFVATTVEGSGIRLDQSHNNTIEGCICNYNVTDCFCHNHGIDGTGSPGVQNAALKGGGIYMTTSEYNSITNCRCEHNNGDNLCSNTGGNGYDNNGGGAGVGGGGGSNVVGSDGTCYTQGGGVYIETTCNNNTVTGCTCSNNNSGNLAFNTGGNGGKYVIYNSGGGGGAGIGGGGGSVYAVGGDGTCYTQGGGVYVETACNNNTVTGCTCSGNNTGNLASNTGGNGSSYDGGGAGVGGGGGSGRGGGGGGGTCYTQGGGVYVETTCNNNIITGCTCSDNNTGNLSSNTGGNGNIYGGGGAGVGGGGGSGYAVGGDGTCYTQGGGVYVETTCNNNIVTGCTCSDNNTGNLASNTGGNCYDDGVFVGGGGAGVGGGGGGGGGVGGGGGGNGTCYTQGGGIFIDTASTRNDINSCECTTNNTDNLYKNTGGTGFNPGEQVGDGGAGDSGAGGIGICYTDGAGIFLGSASCNVVNGCDMVENYTCGIQLGSPFDAGDNTLAENLVMDCSVKGSLDCVQSTSLDGIVSYATTGTNVFENNVVRYCNRGFVQTAAAVDTFLRNTAYKNGTPYANISNVVAFTNPPVTAADNIIIP
jgi:parallel beta-helix repeat protein